MFWKKKKKYKPTGKIGLFRVNDYPYIFIVVMEKICEVGHRSRVKILEVSKACDKTDQECLRWAKFQEWVDTSVVTWETDAQYNERINRVEPVEHEIFVTPEEPPVDYTQHHTNPFRHTFVENTTTTTPRNPIPAFGIVDPYEDDENMPF